MNIISLGWNSFFKKQFKQYRKQGLLPARVLRREKNAYLIICENGRFTAEVTGKFLHQTRRKGDLPVVGDWTVVRPIENEEKVMIHSVLPRKNALKRNTENKEKFTELIAANIDTVFIICGADRDYNPRRIERYLAVSLQNDIEAVVILNKSDLCTDMDNLVSRTKTVTAQNPVYAVSALNRTGFEPLYQYLKAGRTVALLGSSGAGKTTLINSLLDQQLLKTGPVREKDSRGRHTTCYREIIILPDNSMVIDNPGMREVPMLKNQDGLEKTFRDITELEKQCRYSNCQHEQEPGCSVKKAVETGKLDYTRYESYLKLNKEIQNNELPDRSNELSNTFICRKCGQVISTSIFGTENRNHCPYCLWSLHVDIKTGDRRSNCRGLMEPVSIMVRDNGEWVLIHRCRDCGTLRENRIAGDDNELILLSLVVKPLTRPAFPLDRLKLCSTSAGKNNPEE